ncbi:MAG: hypothetical protein WAV07_09075 [Candidatus Contendobacter sp.]
MAGQELRLLHVPVDSGDGCGILNGEPDANVRAELIRQVTAATARHSGHAIFEFLTRLTQPDTLAKAEEAAHRVNAFMLQFTQGMARDEVKRAARRFALVGYAGELASEWDITGWRPGRAIAAAQALFDRWLSAWGTAARHDETTFLEHLEVWLSGNRPGHFAEVDSVTLDMTVHAERALTNMKPFYGFTAATEQGRVYYINAAGWQALTQGFAKSLVIETLTATGRFEKDPKGNKGKQVRVGDRAKNGRYYIFQEESSHVE